LFVCKMMMGCENLIEFLGENRKMEKRREFFGIE
jgi:hypothetical protein